MTDTRQLGPLQRGHVARRPGLPVSTYRQRHVEVPDHDTWERLCGAAGSVDGTFDPAAGRGWVAFETREAADAAQEELCLTS